ncbi:hypothetical protein IWX78_000791 [Mycetocola sp. CAN_C7]|uniref:three-helix bundle dimerization domain-containing protein n=1 Tax=Mycetocola sp. CAN_C7 TaxID=2787724 RepID=UPI0018CA9F45
MTTHIDNEEIIRQVVQALEAKHPDVDRDELEAVVRDEFQTLAERPVRDYLLILTERGAKKRLKKLSAPAS